MSYRCPWLVLGMVCLLQAAEKEPLVGTAANQNLELKAKLHMDPREIREVVGADLPAGYVVIEMTVTPKTEEEFMVSYDNFILLSAKDGQRVIPFTASQIAGSSRLVVGPGAASGGGVMADEQGPVWGGIGGPPVRRGPAEAGGLGNAASHSGVVESEMRTGGEESPLVEVLDRKALPEKKIEKPATGLLYFPLEGKHKPKHLELMFRGQAGKLNIRFVK